MKKVLSLILAFVFVVGICVSAPMTITANAAEAGTLVSNPIVLRDGVKNTKYWTNSNYQSNCYNKIVLGSRGYVDFNITKPYDSEGELSYYYLTIYDPNNNVVWKANTKPQLEGFSESYEYRIGLDKGTYYLNIVPGFYMYSYSDAIQAEYYYTFKETSTYEIEPNNARTQATPLRLGVMYSGVYCEEDYMNNSYIDYFSVKLTKGSKYKLNIENGAKLKDEGYAMLEVSADTGLVSDDINFYYAKESGNTYFWDFKAPETATYYIKLSNGSFRNGVNYKIGVFANISSLSTPTAKVSNTTKGVKVSWNEVANAGTYVVYRSQKSGSSWSGWKTLKTTTAKTYTDTSVKLGVTYKYTVRAVTGNIKSSYKSTNAIKFNATPTVKVSNVSNGVNVSWSKVANATGYTVYSSTYNTNTKKWSGWKNRGTASASKTSWVDKSVKSGGNYKYTVRAVNGSFKSSYNKNGAAIRFLSQPTVKISNDATGMKVSWNKISGSQGYTIYRSEYLNDNWSGWKNMGTINVSNTSWIDKNVVSGSFYRYTVRSVSGNYKSSYKASEYLYYLATPNVSATDSDAGVDVSWDFVEGAARYIVYRKTWDETTNKWSGWTQLDTVYYDNIYVDESAPNYVVCKYTVRAVSGDTKSAFVDSQDAEVYNFPAICSHNYTQATCTEASKCYNCGAIGQVALGHSYSNGYCVRCGIKDNSNTQSTAHTTLRNYLNYYGSTDSDGDKYISDVFYSSDYSTVYTVRVEKSSSDDELSVQMLTKDSASGYERTTFVKVYLTETETQTTAMLYDPDGSDLYAEGYIYKDTFCYNNYKTIYGFYSDASSVSSELKSLLGIETLMALTFADEILYEYGTGISMKDLGFTSLDN